MYAQKEKPLGTSFRPYVYYMKEHKLYSHAKAMQLDSEDERLFFALKPDNE